MDFVKSLIGGAKVQKLDDTSDVKQAKKLSDTKQVKKSLGVKQHKQGGESSSSKKILEMNGLARVYRIELDKKNEETGEQKVHTVVHIPKTLRRVDSIGCTLSYPEREALLQQQQTDGIGWTYNIAMFDVSGSMSHYWFHVVKFWNSLIKPKLDGQTDIYAFDDRLRYCHNKPWLQEGFYSGHGTNLAAPLMKIRKLVNSAPHKHIRVFLVTDGRHRDNGGKKPEDVLNYLRPVKGKRVDVYVLGIAYDFPVELSISLRSKLHTGPSQVPPLFWAKSPRDLYDQVEAIAEEIYPSIYVDLSIPTILMPGINELRDVAFPGEFLYFDKPPEAIKANLDLLCQDEPKVKFNTGWRREAEKYYSHAEDMDMHHMMEDRMCKRMMMMDFRMMHSRGGGRRDMENPTEEMMEEMFGEDMDDEMFEEMCHFNGLDPSKMRRKKSKMDNPDAPIARLDFSSKIYDADTKFLMDVLFKTWCSVLLQRSKNKQEIDMTIYEIMADCFNVYADKEAAIATAGTSDSNQTIQARLQRKTKMSLKTEFDRFIKGSKETVDITNKFGDEIKLAEKVLLTTVQDKYQKKVLLKKGYGGSKEWNEDMHKFVTEYNKIKDQIQALPEPSPDESCRIMMQSFLGDLKDDNFKKICSEGKLNFLKEMTFSGVPAYAPPRNSTQFNPWTIHIKNICVSPYEIICQRVMEEYAVKNYSLKHSRDKAIYLKGIDERSKMNIVVPLIPREYTELLKPLVNTAIFAVACSYCILKNANIIDRNCHLAALGCIWMRTIREFPPATRPEYVKNRILNIEANARLYLGRKTIDAYVECLYRYPPVSLTTDADSTFKQISMKCESLIKPAFLLHLSKTNEALLNQYGTNIPKFIQLITLEFFGRCITKYQSETPFVDFFLPVVEKDSRKTWLKEKSDEIYSDIEKSGEVLLAEHADLYSLRKFVSKTVNKKVDDRQESLHWNKMVHNDSSKQESFNRAVVTVSHDSDDDDDDDVRRYGSDEEIEYEDDNDFDEESCPVNLQIKTLSPNFVKIEKLRNSGSVGQMTFKDLQAWAEEMLYSLGPQQQPPPPSHGGGAGGGGGDMQGDYDENKMQTQLPGEASGAAPEAGESSKKWANTVHLIQEDIDYAFNVSMISLYIYQSITYRSSKERLRTALISTDEALEKIEENIEAEWKRVVTSELKPMIEERIVDDWMDAYSRVHLQNLARPLSRQQIIAEARSRGIEVNEENFKKIYKYRANVGLCSNCCMVESCPHYLLPSKRTNAHLEVERESGLDFPHTLHLACSYTGTNNSTETTSIIRRGRLTGTQNRKTTYTNYDSEKLKEHVENLKKMYDEYREKDT